MLIWLGCFLGSYLQHGKPVKEEAELGIDSSQEKRPPIVAEEQLGAQGEEEGGPGLAGF